MHRPFLRTGRQEVVTGLTTLEAFSFLGLRGGRWVGCLWPTVGNEIFNHPLYRGGVQVAPRR